MQASLSRLVHRYRNRGILIDSNLLVLLLIGAYDSTLVPRFRRTSSFRVEGYVLLNNLSTEFSRIVVTPNTLTEVSNLIGERGGLLPDRFFTQFSATIAELFKESYTRSSAAAKQSCFARLGLADSVIATLKPNKYLVLTDDLDLYLELARRQLDVINFNHVRQAAFES